MNLETVYPVEIDADRTLNFTTLSGGLPYDLKMNKTYIYIYTTLICSPDTNGQIPIDIQF